MDNRTIDVVSAGDEMLALAVALAWHPPGGKATHYKVVRKREQPECFNGPGSAFVTRHIMHHIADEKAPPTLILLWHDEDYASPLPFPLDKDGAVDFIRGWLRHNPRQDEPDIDGDCKPAWRIFTQEWGHVWGNHYAIIGVQVAWAMYGK